MSVGDNIRLLYIDLFCGAGGTSTGVEAAMMNGDKCAKVIACVNHDRHAIASHSANHPDAVHYTEDIRTLDITELIEHADKERRKYSGSKVVLWASLECTNFSKAKGGLPRDADSRTLADHLFRYIEGLDPDYIQIENVKEFMSWGDLDDKGKPVSKDAGRLYMLWVSKVRSYGYHYDYRILNSADYGAYTSRRRFFGIFARKGLPISFPEPSHEKNPKNGIFGQLQPWKPVREVLDLNDEGKSIFGRKKPLVDATLKRIHAGLVKFVAGGKDAFLVKWNSMNRAGIYHAPGVDEPCPTIATQNRLGVAKVSFLSKQFSGEPESKNITIDGPAGAITTKDHHAFITAYYGNGGNHSIDAPAPTITTKDRLACVTPFIVNQYSGWGLVSDMDSPCPTLLTNPKQNIVVCKPWIMNTNFNNVGSSIDDPAQTITANRKWHYLMNPQFSSPGGSVDKPCFTLIARMDKMPPYLMAASCYDDLPDFIKKVDDGLLYEVYESDSKAMVEIKLFMAMYGITDIKMRMLNETELKLIMGFPREYVLIGTQAEKKKYIGNAVVTIIPKVWAEALVMANDSRCKNVI